jgi:hypothetical protein
MAISQPPTDTEVAFPRFGSLPVELRLMIWRFAAFSPRYLELYRAYIYKNYRRDRPKPQQSIISYDWKVKAAQPPALLSTCRESRSEVQVLLRYGKAVHHLFNPDIDVICISSDWYISLDGVLLQLERKLRGRVRRLAIMVRDTRFSERHGIIPGGLGDALPTLKGLTEIQFIFAGRSLVEAVGFKELKDLNSESGAGITQGLFEKEFERIRLRERDGEWEMPTVRYGSFEYGEVILNVKQMLKEGGEEKCDEKNES